MSVTIKWSRVRGANSYEVRSGTNSDDTFAEGATEVNCTSASEATTTTCIDDKRPHAGGGNALLLGGRQDSRRRQRCDE